jgi:hypothetical protein
MAIVPHSGYHWHRGSDRFFEGWYFRITLPQVKQSFVFMYAIDDPQGNTPYSGGSMQVLGVDEELIWRTLPNTQDFFADPDAVFWNIGVLVDRDIALAIAIIGAGSKIRQRANIVIGTMKLPQSAPGAARSLNL